MKTYFTNTKDNKSLRSAILIFSVIMVFEYVIVSALILGLIPQRLLAFTLFAGLTLLEFGLLAYYFLPLLVSKHRLIEGELKLCLGKSYSTKIALDDIDKVTLLSNSTLPRKDSIGLICLRDNDTLYFLGGYSHIFSFDLKKSILVKAASVRKNEGKKGYVNRLVINFDDPNLVATYFDIQERESVSETEKTTSTPFKTPEKPQVKIGDKPILELKEITYSYNNFQAVKPLSLQVYPGEIFGFLGSNGAGKSSTLKMITGLLKPQKGKILLDGENLWGKEALAVRKKIGYVPDTPIVYWGLTAREHLLYTGRLYGIKKDVLESKINDLLVLLDLIGFENGMIKSYSQGMQRKVSLALALLIDPQILIIDEFTNAYDAATLAKIKEICFALKEEGKTVFFSGHVMSVAEEISDRISILHKGELISCGTVEEVCEIRGEKVSLEDYFLSIAGGYER